jgi:hypothetical protein
VSIFKCVHVSWERINKYIWNGDQKAKKETKGGKREKREREEENKREEGRRRKIKRRK